MDGGVLPRDELSIQPDCSVDDGLILHGSDCIRRPSGGETAWLRGGSKVDRSPQLQWLGAAGTVDTARAAEGAPPSPCRQDIGQDNEHLGIIAARWTLTSRRTCLVGQTTALARYSEQEVGG